MNTIIRLLQAMWTGFGPVVFVSTTLASLLGIGAALPDLLSSLSTRYAAAVASIPTTNIAGYYATANALTPLTETLALMVVLLGVSLVCLIIRIIKGLIPTYG